MNNTFEDDYYFPIVSSDTSLIANDLYPAVEAVRSLCNDSSVRNVDIQTYVEEIPEKSFGFSVGWPYLEFHKSNGCRRRTGVRITVSRY